jgi:hypothetical protein
LVTTRTPSTPESCRRPFTTSTSARGTTRAWSPRSTSRSPARRSRPAPIWYLEDGFQTTVAASRRSLYAGRESVTGAVSGAGQAAQLATALRLAYCQPRVTAFFNFLLVDEPSLGRWQSGLLWADWKRKPAFGAYRAAIAEVRARTVACASPGVID